MPYIGASPDTTIDQKDLNGQKLIIDADADTSIHASTDDQIDVEVAGADVLQIKSSSGDAVIKAAVDAKDILFQQYDGRTILDVNDGGYVAIANGATGAGQLRLYEDTDNGTNYSAFQVGTQSADLTYTLPTADGSDGHALKTDGSGTLSWGAVAANTPTSADGQALGSTSAEWSDLYLADGGVIYFGNDQDVTVTHDPDDGLFLKSKATGTANPFVLTLQTGETDITTNDVLGTINFQAPDEHNGSDAILVGASIRAIAEENFAADNNATAIQFLTARSETAATIARIGSRGTFEAQSGSTSYCSFTDIDDGHTGMYFPAGDTVGFVSGGSENVRVANYRMYIADTGNSMQSAGLTINQLTADNEIFALKSSDIAHSATGSSEADTYFRIQKYSATAGGIYPIAFTEGNIGLWMDVFHDTQSAGAATSAVSAPLNYRAVVTANSYAHSANVALFAWRKTISGGSSQNIVVFDEDGDIHLDGSTSAFDKYDDALLCRSFDLAQADPKSIIKSEFDDWTINHKEKLIDAGILGRIDPDNPAHYSYPKDAVEGSPASDPSNPPVLAEPMINSTQLQRLHNGAIWQQRLMFETLKEVAEELLPGFASKLNERLESRHLPALPV